MSVASATLVALVAGAVAGAGMFLLVTAVRGLPPQPSGIPAGRTRRLAGELAGPRSAVAVLAALVTLAATRWAVAAAGVALLVLGWRGLAGAGGERRALARLESLANWTESLRDTIAGAVGLEQAIPASLRAVAPELRAPLTDLVDRLHTRVSMAQALRRFADDLDDPGADLIIAALIINSQLRGPGLRDLLGALSRSVREELDLRRRVYSERRSTRRSAQIVVAVSVGLALALAVADHAYVQTYDSVIGQAVLVAVVGLYAAGIAWMRSLARFGAPQRLFSGGEPPPLPDAVAAWRGGVR